MSKQPWDSGNMQSAGGEHVDHLLSSYMDNDLESEARSAVRRHLQECSDCRATYIELEATRKLLGSLPTVPPPRAFTITPEMARVRAPRKAAPPTFWERFFSPHNAPRFAFGSLVAVVLTAIALVSAVLSSEPYGSYTSGLSIPPAEQSNAASAEGTRLPNASSFYSKSPSGDNSGSQQAPVGAGVPSEGESQGGTSSAGGAAATGGSGGGGSVPPVVQSAPVTLPHDSSVAPAAAATST